jgi:hypothetical protein
MGSLHGPTPPREIHHVKLMLSLGGSFPPLPAALPVDNLVVITRAAGDQKNVRYRKSRDGNLLTPRFSRLRYI